VKCKFVARERQVDKKKGERRAVKTKILGNLLHNCLTNAANPETKRCFCRTRINDEEARRLIENGDAVNFDSRSPVFIEGAPLLVVGKVKKTPRSATVEQCHMERMTERASSIRATEKRQKEIEELQKAVEQDRAERKNEEAVRLEIYGELTQAERRSWIVKVPADEYDKAERSARGRAVFVSVHEERTPGGIGIDVDPVTLRPIAPVEIIEEDEEIEQLDSTDSEVGIEEQESCDEDEKEKVAVSMPQGNE